MKKKVNYKLLFCYCLLFFALIILFAVIFFKPQKKSVTYMYDTTKETHIEKLPLKIIQYIHPSVTNINGLYIFFEDDSLLNCNFQVDINDEKGVNYFSQYVENYKSNILYLAFNKKTKLKDLTFKIEIDFSKCSQLNGMIGNPINKDNSLDYDINKTLKVSIEGLEPNNSYYWYIAMISAIAFLLLPLAKEDNNEI